MALYNGILGTVGGLRIDTDARVQSLRGGPIEGLYAVGNVASGIFGQTYPGGGCTLGPGLTFGYLAGQHVAAESPQEIERRETVGQA
jgi:3-oxosteroid 1-dehydrogenase